MQRVIIRRDDKQSHPRRIQGRPGWHGCRQYKRGAAINSCTQDEYVWAYRTRRMGISHAAKRLLLQQSAIRFGKRADVVKLVAIPQRLRQRRGQRDAEPGERRRQ